MHHLKIQRVTNPLYYYYILLTVRQRKDQKTDKAKKKKKMFQKILNFKYMRISLCNVSQIHLGLLHKVAALRKNLNGTSFCDL